MTEIKEGTRVLFNDRYPGTVRDVLPNGMCNVRGERGEVCVDRSSLVVIADLEREMIKHGTENQQERWAAGFLPEAEFAQLARVQLFQKFAQFPRWATGKDRERLAKLMKHQRSQPGLPDCAAPHEYEYEVCDAGEMNPDEWRMCKEVERVRQQVAAVLGDGRVKLDIAQQWITCKECRAEVDRVVAKVTIYWAGRELVREYAIDPVRYDEAQRGLR